MANLILPIIKKPTPKAVPTPNQYTSPIGPQKPKTSSPPTSPNPNNFEPNISTEQGQGYSTPDGEITYPQTYADGKDRPSNNRGGGGGRGGGSGNNSSQEPNFSSITGEQVYVAPPKQSNNINNQLKGNKDQAKTNAEISQDIYISSLKGNGRSEIQPATGGLQKSYNLPNVLDRIGNFLGYKKGQDNTTVNLRYSGTVGGESTAIGPTKSGLTEQKVLFNPNLIKPTQVLSDELANKAADRAQATVESRFQGTSFEESTAQAEFQKEFQKELNNLGYEQKIKDNQDFKINIKDYYKTPGDKISSKKEIAIDALASLTPLSPVYFAGKTGYYAAKAQKEDIFLLEKDSKGNPFVPLYPDVYKQSESGYNADIYAGVLAGEALIGSINNPIVKQAQKELLQDLSKQRFKISGQELFNNEKGSFVKVYGERSLPNGFAKQTIEFNLPSFVVKKGDIVGVSESGSEVILKKGDEFSSFFITKGKANTKVVNYIDTNMVFKNSETFSGGGRIRGVDASITLKNPKTKTGLLFDEDIKAGVGKGYLNTNGKTKQFPIYGLGKETDEGYNVLSGRLRKGILSNDIPKIGIKLRGNIESYGTIKKSPIKLIDSETDSFGTTILGGGKSSSKSVFKTDSKTSLATGNIVKELESELNLGLNTQTKQLKNTRNYSKKGATLNIFNDGKQKSITTTKSRNIFSESLKPLSLNLENNNTKQNTNLKLFPLTKNVFKNRSNNRSRTGIFEIPALKLEQKQTNRLRTPARNFIPNNPGFGRNFTYGTPLPPLSIPKFQLLDYGRSRSGKGKIFKTRYTPNIASLALGIKSKAIPKSYLKGLGGITIRPLITSKRTSKARRRKNKK